MTKSLSHISAKKIIILSVLIGLFLSAQWVVKRFKNPNQMGVIESQAMDMTVETPVGAVPVATEVVKPVSFAGSVTYTGSVVGYNETSVYPRISGRIVSLPVYPGDRIKEGQLLIKLDSSELTARLNASRFAHMAATQQFNSAVKLGEKSVAETERSKEAIKSAKAEFDYWQEEIKRARELVKEDVITQEEAQREESQFISSQSRYKQALADLNASVNSQASAAYQTDAQQAQALEAASNLQAQQIVYGYSRIVAPYNGIVTERLISPGTLVEPGMQILKLAQINPVRIQVNVAQSDLASIKLGNKVAIWKSNNRQDKPVYAKVTSIFPSTNPQTRTTIVEALVDNKSMQFMPGDFVTADIETGVTKDTITVPVGALVDFEGQKAVWVVKNNTAHLKLVTTGDTNGARVAIAKGLNVNDIVINRNIDNLHEGDKVVSAKFGADGIDVLPQAYVSNRLSEENGYKIKQDVQHYVVLSNISPRPPVIGSNDLQITLSSTHEKLPENLDISVAYLMPAMPKMAVAKPKVKKIGKDSFKIKLMFSMPGLWQMNLTFKEGNKTILNTVVETEVPE